MPQLARPLRRSRTNRQIAGVVGGLAEHFAIDPTLLRVIYVVVSVVSVAFPGLLVYLLLWLLIPADDDGGRTLLLSLALLSGLGASAGAQTPPAGPSPDSLFDRREAQIPARDGTRLFTVVLVPKTKGPALPFLLTRTPYGAAAMASSPRTMAAYGELIHDGYILVFQDIRGRYQSEGQFVMNRPPCAHRGAGCLDEATDTYDSIDWLLRHVPNNNGRVGQLGISYPGWLTNASAFGPHPALKALSPQATMGDTWMGDDFFHQGAFRLTYGLEYAWSMEASKDQSVVPAPGRFDTYDWYRSFPTLDSLARAVGADAWPTWRRFVAHPAYDSVWQERSLVRRLSGAALPTLTVGGFWDQEDLYGPQATYRAMERSDSAGRNFIVLGPWYHGQWAREAGDSLGNARFGSNTGEYYRRQIEARWFRRWLKDNAAGDRGAAAGDSSAFAEATEFDAGAQRWRTFTSWPPTEAQLRRLYFLSDGRLGFEPPSGSTGSDQYRSDPAHPVPYRPRPVEWTYDPRGSRWRRWMTEDQRFVDGRPDVLVWQTAPLTEDLTIAGDVTARLFASTTGSDADWVVKLIDVYPDSVEDRPQMGGYELMVAGEIMRGRYYKGWERPQAIPPNRVVAFTVDLHQQAYTFRRGHRIMAQVQSTWFPLYDRNPQTFVPNIFHARASDYRAQTHRIMRTADAPSHVELRVLADSAAR